jgi:hypothetical protein
LERFCGSGSLLDGCILAHSEKQYKHVRKTWLKMIFRRRFSSESLTFVSHLWKDFAEIVELSIISSKQDSPIVDRLSNETISIEVPEFLLWII